mgnify:CR=1 FL=1
MIRFASVDLRFVSCECGILIFVGIFDGFRICLLNVILSLFLLLQKK